VAVAISRTANPAGVADDGTVDHVTLYSGVAIGATATDRMIVVAIGKEAGAVGTVFPFSAALDVGGTVYDLVQIGSSAEFGAMGAYLWRTQAFVTAGTTADLYVGWAAAVTAVQNNVAVYRITGAALTPSSQGVNTSTDMDATVPLTTGSRTIATDGGMLAVAVGSSDTNAKTWAQLTEDLDVDAGAFRLTVAFSTTAGTATRTCTGGANGEDGALAWAIFVQGAKSLAAGTDSYAITGTTANTKLGRKVAAATNSYAITGTAVTLRKSIPVAIGAGSYAITGTAASLRHGWAVAAGAGSYAITGTAVTLRRNLPLVVGAGSYAVTGTAASLLQTRLVTVGAGSYAVTGTAATLRHAWVVPVGVESYSITGTAASLSLGRKVVAGAGSYAITGTDVTLTKAGGAAAYTLTADPGSYAITGTAASLLAARRITAGAGSYAITGTDASLVHLHKLIAENTAYSITGSSVGLVYSAAPPSGGEGGMWRQSYRRRHRQ
jgi:hypothetical protein